MTEAQFSIADIAGIDMDQVEEYRFQLPPQGAYVWQCQEAGLDTIGQDPGTPAAVMTFKALETHGLVGLNPSEAEQDFVGVEHREVFFLREAKDIGRVKAFLVDAGFAATGPFGDMLKRFGDEKTTFAGRIKHRPDKNDKDKKYANINLDRKAAPKEA
mgnify:CR=1 FL=1